MNIEPKFCPECGIGLEGAEIRMRFCQNCKTHWDISEPDFFDEEDDFQECDDCDGHDACRDFGCAFKHGLGHLVQPPL